MANIIGGKIGASSVVVNDYNISIENIEGGHRLKIKRGSEIQNLDVMDGATGPQGAKGDTFTADFGQTVYGGTLDWNTGVLTVTHGQIAAYAGESLPGAWISDRDVYADGAMPTTGAQVVYELATPQTIQLTPQEIAALEGLNTLYSSTGDTAVAGRTDIGWLTQCILDRLAALEAAAVSE